jgi:hypothetical protein
MEPRVNIYIFFLNVWITLNWKQNFIWSKTLNCAGIMMHEVQLISSPSAYPSKQPDSWYNTRNNLGILSLTAQGDERIRMDSKPSRIHLILLSSWRVFSEGRFRKGECWWHFIVSVHLPWNANGHSYPFQTEDWLFPQWRLVTLMRAFP